MSQAKIDYKNEVINDKVDDIQFARDRMKMRIANSPDDDRKSNKSKGKKKGGLKSKDSSPLFGKNRTSMNDSLIDNVDMSVSNIDPIFQATVISDKKS